MKYTTKSIFGLNAQKEIKTLAEFTASWLDVECPHLVDIFHVRESLKKRGIQAYSLDIKKVIDIVYNQEIKKKFYDAAQKALQRYLVTNNYTGVYIPLDTNGFVVPFEKAVYIDFPGFNPVGLNQHDLLAEVSYLVNYLPENKIINKFLK